MHVYLTYPFMLSWSLLDAMACGCAIVGSATGPVMEVIRDGENGVLADFFDAPELAEKIAALVETPTGGPNSRPMPARRFLTATISRPCACPPTSA